jgi:putative spermidine/putrescine transport system permease protein
VSAAAAGSATGGAGAVSTRPPPTLRHRLADRGVDRVLLLLIPGVVFLVALFIYPFFYGLQLSLTPTTGGALDSYQAFFDDPYLRDTIGITMWLALPAALLNVLASVPIAYRMRGRFRGKRTLTTLLVVPITLGTVLTAEGLIEYLGPSGWVNKFLRDFHLVNQPLILVHNYWGVFFSLVITGFPFAFLLVLSYMSGIDPSLEKAAAIMGARWPQRFRYVVLPLLAPGLAITFCLAFVLAFSVFPSANLVGNPAGDTHVISIAAFHAAFEQFNYSLGSAIAMVMAAVMLAVIVLVLVWRSRLYRGATGGKG